MKKKPSKKKLAEQIHQLSLRSDDSNRIKWLQLQQKGYDFYLNDQLTSEQLSALEGAGMPDFIINRIMPIIEIMLYFATAGNPRWKCVGVDGSDSDLAEIHSQVADRGWYLSGGQRLFADIVRDALTKSLGFFYVDIDRDADRGRGEVLLRRLEPFDVILDNHTTDPTLADCGYILVRKQFPKSQLAKLLPQYKNKIMKASGEATNRDYSKRNVDESESIQTSDLIDAVDDTGETDDMVDYFEKFEKIRVPYVNVYIMIPPTEKEMAQVKEMVDMQVKEFRTELEVQFEETKVAITQQLENNEIIPERAKWELEKAQKQMEQAVKEKQQLLFSKARDEASTVENKIVTKEEFQILYESSEFRNTLVDFAEYYETRINKICTVGCETFLYEEQLGDLDEFPIVAIPYLWTGSPFAMSAVTPLIGKQQEINKAHQIMLHNANLASNLRWLYAEGELNEDDWENYSSSSGALLKYNPGISSNGPREVSPQPLNNAFFSIVQEGKSDMEYISGVMSQLMGFTQDSPDTYRGLLANDEYGTRRIRQWISNVVEPALERVGRVFMKRAQSHYDIHKIFRLVQPNAGNQTEEVEINIPIYSDYGDVIGRFNDYQSTQLDIRIIPGSTLPLNRWALLEEYFRWFQAGILDDISFVAETDIRNKEQLLKRKSLYAEMKQSIEGLEESLKSSKGDNETIRRELIHAKTALEVMRGKLEQKGEVMETKQQQKALRAEGRQAVDNMKKQLERDREVVKAKIGYMDKGKKETKK